MTLLDQVQKGKQRRPRRAMLYGTHGVGKSTFGSMADRPIFIATEDGLGEIDCDKFPLAVKYADVLAALSAPTAAANTGSPGDEITALVERSVDERLNAAVGELSLDQLLGEARERHRRSAANYVI